MQGLNMIHLPGQRDRNDNCASYSAAKIIDFDRTRYFTGSNVTHTSIHRRTLDEGGFVARTRRGQVMASRVNRALRRNIARLDAALDLVNAIRDRIWYAGIAPTYNENVDLRGSCGRIRIEVSEWLGRACISINGPDADMCLYGSDGSMVPMRAPGLSVHLVDDASAPGRCGIQSLTGDAYPLMAFMREALFNSQRLVASIKTA